MSRELAAHDEVLRTVVVEHRGKVFKHTGDGICAVFGSAVDAVRAAVVAQERLSLPVRMGLHTGEAEQRDGDWFGIVPQLRRADHGRRPRRADPVLGGDRRAASQRCRAAAAR